MSRHIPRTRRALATAVAAVVVSMTAPDANAVTRDWTAASGNFNTPANWSGGVVPVVGDTARFLNAATYAVTFDLSPSNTGVEVSAGTVTFRPDLVASRTYALSTVNVTGGSLTLADPTSGANTITLAPTGALNISNAAIAVQGGNAVNLAGIFTVDAGGTFTVTGSGSTYTQSGGSTNNVGTATGAAALVSVTSAGTFITGTGLLNINPTGTVSISGGSATFNGSISLDGGRLERLTSTGFNLAAGKGVIAQNNGQVAFTGSYAINNGTAFTLNSGADLSTTSFLDIGRIGNGTLTLDGLGSSVTATSTSIWGSAGNIATVSIRNRATANFAAVTLGDANAATIASFEVLGGATGTLTSSLNIGTAGGGVATVNVGSVSTTSTLNAGTTTTIGGASGSGSAELVIDPGGVFNAGTGPLTVNATGEVDVNAGGTFNGNGNITVNAGGVVTIANGGNFVMPASRTLAINNGGVFTNNNDWTTLANTSVQTNGSASLLSMPTRTLTLTGGSLLTAQTGGDANIGTLTIGDASGFGNAQITGAGSTLTLGQGIIGFGNSSNILTVSSGASANVAGTLAIGAGSSGSSGGVNVDNAGLFVGGDLWVGFSASAAFGSLTVTNNGTVSQADGWQTNIGSGLTGGATGFLNISTGGHLITGTGGLFTVNAGSTVQVNGGQLDVNDHITVRNGGHLERTTAAGSAFTWAATGRSMLVDQGSSVVLNDTTLALNDSFVTVSNNSGLQLPGGGINASRNTQMNLVFGGQYTADTLNLGFAGLTENTLATLLVDGYGSSVASGTSATFGVTAAAAATFRNNALGTFNQLTIGGSGFSSSDGTLDIQTGADLSTSGSLSIGASGLAGSSGAVTLNGIGSTLAVATTSGVLSVGATSGSTGVLNINNGATLTVSGTTFLAATGTINLSGGSATFAGLVPSGGALNFNSGTLTIGDTVAITPGGALGASVNLTPNHVLTVNQLNINTASAVTLNGGTLSASSITNNGGTLAFNSGTINLTGGFGLNLSAGGGIGAVLDLGALQTFNVSSVTNIGSDGTLAVNNGAGFSTGGINNGGEMRLGGGTARITSNPGINNNKLITGDGRVVGVISNNLNGEVRVNSGQRIYSTNGINNFGKINLLGGTFESDIGIANNAGGTISGRGTLIARGGTGNSGNIQFSGGTSDVFGLTINNSGGRIIVSGNALATFYDEVWNNNGGEIRVSNGSTAVFFGNVTNQGTFANTGTKFFESTSTGVLGAVTSGGTTIVANGAKVSASLVREAALTVEGDMALTAGGGTSRVGTLDVGNGGRLDLSNNKMIVTAAAAADIGSFDGASYSGLTGQIALAYDFGAWDGQGITTTQSAASAQGLTTVAIAAADQTPHAGGTFGGLAVNSGDILLMYTYAGDANLDGVIDGGDYGTIDNFIQVPGADGYANGDFNYDGVIDGGDYGIIDNNIQAQGVGFPTSAPFTLSGVTAVPEPSAYGFAVTTGSAMLLPRRARRRRSVTL